MSAPTRQAHKAGTQNRHTQQAHTACKPHKAGTQNRHAHSRLLAGLFCSLFLLYLHFVCRTPHTFLYAALLTQTRFTREIILGSARTDSPDKLVPSPPLFVPN